MWEGRHGTALPHVAGRPAWHRALARSVLPRPRRTMAGAAGLLDPAEPQVGEQDRTAIVMETDLVKGTKR